MTRHLCPRVGVLPSATRLLPIAVSLLLTAFCLLPTAYAQGTGGAKGRIRNSRGEGIAGVTISARQNSTDVCSSKSNNKGEFVVSGLEPGVYNFVFDAKGYSSGIRYNIEVKRDKTTDLGDRLILLVDKGTLVIVQGSVFFHDGRSVTGAKVEIEKVNADGTTRSFPSVFTSVSGEFVFRQPEGTAKFRITAKYKDKTASKEIEVDSAAIYRLALTLNMASSER